MRPGLPSSLTRTGFGTTGGSIGTGRNLPHATPTAHQTTCNGCWGWLVDEDTNTMVWQGAVPFGMFRALVCADAYRPERQVWAVSQGALYPGLQLALEVKE